MIEYLNNPAMLVLACEAIIFLFIINIVLALLLTKKNGKTVKALNALVHEIKAKSDEQKKKMTELLLQPELLDPDTIKKGMQELAGGQTQLYKDIIKAVRTQSEEDVVALGNSVAGLVDSALKLGRESGEGSVDKEAQAKLEAENENLSEANTELKDKLDKAEQEAEVVMQEYNSMMDNVKADEGSEEASEEETEETSAEQSNEGSEEDAEAGLEMSDDILDVTSGEGAEEESSSGEITAQEEVDIEESVDEDQELIDIADEMPMDDGLLDGLSDDIDTAAAGEEISEAAEAPEEKMDDIAETPEDMADEILGGMMDDLEMEEQTVSSEGENKDEAA